MPGDWADVYIPAIHERQALEGKALFFLPHALDRLLPNRINRAYLEALSRMHRDGEPRAGRGAINKVFRMHPVTYQSALGFINVANLALREVGAGELTTTEIVACVFRLREPEAIANELGLKEPEIAQRTRLRPEVVRAALARFRLQLNDALAIWELFREQKRYLEIRSPMLDLLTDRPEDFIKTDDRYPVAVRPLGEDGFVYTWDNLRFAPPIGHPWSIG